MTGMAIASLISSGISAYSAYEQHESSKDAQRRQDQSIRQAEEEALKQGPQATTLSEEDNSFEKARLNLLRRGFYGNVKNSLSGLGSSASTASTGLKGTLG